MKHHIIKSLLLVWLALIQPLCAWGQEEAQEIVQSAFDHYRGKASEATVEMVIHRPDWERGMQMEVWTQGAGDSLIHITAPAKDRDNGTLKKGRDMWTYNPKVNRTIKLPPALMAQSWMGSDFSNNDLAKSDSLINDYVHTLSGTATDQGHRVYIIKSVPKSDAPVVWGMQVLHIRDDHVILSEEFYDEDLKPVKRMTGEQIQMMGGRMFPKVWRMQESDKEDQYTLLRYHELQFLDHLPDGYFTLNRLKNPPER
jgi:outer membrane lipoprotein-sorting protein